MTECEYCENPLRYGLKPAAKIKYQRMVYPEWVYDTKSGRMVCPPSYEEEIEHTIHLDIYPQAHYLGIRCRKDEQG